MSGHFLLPGPMPEEELKQMKTRFPEHKPDTTGQWPAAEVVFSQSILNGSFCKSLKYLKLFIIGWMNFLHNPLDSAAFSLKTWHLPSTSKVPGW